MLTDNLTAEIPAIARRLVFYLATRRWPRARLERYQDLMLGRALRQAYSGVPGYRRLLKRKKINPWRFRGRRDLARLPLLDKCDLREFAAELEADRPQLPVHHWAATSGSTGTPLRLPLSRESVVNDMAAILRCYLEAGYFPGKKVFSAKDYFQGWVWRRALAGRSLDFDINQLSPASAALIRPRIKKLRPRFFHGYPFALMMLGIFAREADSDYHRPEVIISISESLTPYLRQRLDELYGARIFNIYSMVENCALAYDCRAGVMHLAEDFAYHEVLRADGSIGEDGCGEIIATSFYNPVLPLLRYRTADLAEILPAAAEGCACGRAGRTIRNLQGRVEDFIRTPAGKTINLLERPMNQSRGVLLSQYVQDRPDHVYVNVVPGPDFEPGSLAAARQELGERLGADMNIDFKLVEKLERRSEHSAKTPFLLSKIGNRLYEQ